MSFKSKTVSFLVAAAMSLALFAPAALAAEQTAPAGDAGGKADAKAEVKAEVQYPVTVVDQAGREVVIEEPVESIAICWYMANDFVLALGADDKLVAIGPHDEFQSLVAPRLDEIDTVGRGKPDMEKLADLDPDLFVHRVSDPDNLAACDALGIDAIAIAPETADETKEALTMVATALGETERAEMLIDLYDSIVDIATQATADVKDKPTFLLLGKELGGVANDAMMQAQMIVAGGGVNLAADVETNELWPVAGVEQIFAWDPDFIFVSQTAEYTAADLLADPAWADLNAVKAGHVYDVPGKLHNWENLGLAPCLGTVWSMMKMYPDAYSEEEFDKLVVDFYKTVYDLDVTREMMGY